MAAHGWGPELAHRWWSSRGAEGSGLVPGGMLTTRVGRPRARASSRATLMRTGRLRRHRTQCVASGLRRARLPRRCRGLGRVRRGWRTCTIGRSCGVEILGVVGVVVVVDAPREGDHRAITITDTPHDIEDTADIEGGGDTCTISWASRLWSMRLVTRHGVPVPGSGLQALTPSPHWLGCVAGPDDPVGPCRLERRGRW